MTSRRRVEAGGSGSNAGRASTLAPRTFSAARGVGTSSLLPGHTTAPAEARTSGTAARRQRGCIREQWGRNGLWSDQNGAGLAVLAWSGPRGRDCHPGRGGEWRVLAVCMLLRQSTVPCAVAMLSKRHTQQLTSCAAAIFTYADSCSIFATRSSWKKQSKQAEALAPKNGILK